MIMNQNPRALGASGLSAFTLIELLVVIRNAMVLILMAVTLAATALGAEAGWVNLFNGQDLTGWVQRGGQASYTVEHDTIVGTSVLNTPNIFLCTEKTYGDFIPRIRFQSGPQAELRRADSQRMFRHAQAGGMERQEDPDSGRSRSWLPGGD